MSTTAAAGGSSSNGRLLPPPTPHLLYFPSEILLTVLHYLDIPDLYTLTKTSRHLRATATDPLLHRQRLQHAKSTLAHTLAQRPSVPPPPPVFLTPQQATQRCLSRKLAKIALKRKLAARPDLPTLVSRGVIPAKASIVAPALLAPAQELEKQRIKDVLRGWVGRSKSLEEVAEREGWDGVRPDDDVEEKRPRVIDIARRYERGRRRDTRWGSERRVKYDPPRAKVLGLRRFYEMLSRGVASS
ncbi:hypothetical protein FN846DRAFT_467027 [Sphaerosporella brunnea]|uniref:F-box domain-containing protein n=1 Tax=Sphaerosporella brunnea TaxID=1250544 RepID=A0A5J5F4E5_9PEZI|nr:hypothetical protein FN846DRAFT_467027 [Sphaerosporella brunnea]